MEFVYISVLNNHKNNFHVNTGIIRSMISLKMRTRQKIWFLAGIQGHNN